MTRRRETSPPRPITPGDVVAAYSEELGEWTAAQVTDLDPAGRTAGVLELDWSGPEPSSVEELGALVPLRLHHHAHDGGLSHCNFAWVLPRSYKVLGNVPLLHERRSNSYSSGWNIGDQLARQRQWERGERSPHRTGGRSLLGAELADLVARSEPFTEVRSLTITGIAVVDGDDVAALFPNLTHLKLSGNLGTLNGAAGLNRLRSLKWLHLIDLFGMSASDCLSSTAVPDLEMLWLHSVPAEYATAMSEMWAREAGNGTLVEISSPRDSGWVAENRDNPLRDWDGREHISAAQYRRSVRQFMTTRRAVLDVLAAPGGDTDEARLTDLGSEFGEAFNQFDGTDDPFIETVEREELFDALDAIVDEAEAAHGRTFATAREFLVAGVEEVRDW
ncbi:hypothetical protein ACQEVZ_03440 [Dactylosporangium sp. CA-152071]|uniref:hypothetical protein n=1 Tax=Dactylosporangium sp. CA-152071 TaxID=3239933 RepID=UPI003D9056C4